MCQNNVLINAPPPAGAVVRAVRDGESVGVSRPRGQQPQGAGGD